MSRLVSSERGFDGLKLVVVDVTTLLQWPPSLPAAGRNAKLRRFVQPPASGLLRNKSGVAVIGASQPGRRLPLIAVVRGRQ